ncbi:MAG: cation:proton antiporter, partial [Thermococcus sp.]
MVSVLKRGLAIITLLIIGYWLAQGLAGVPFGQD